MVKITTTHRITGTHPHKGKAVDRAEEVRRKRVGSKRRRGGIPRKAKSPWPDKNRLRTDASMYLKLLMYRSQILAVNLSTFPATSGKK